MNIPLILIIVVLAFYLAWKLLGTGKKKKTAQHRFNIRKHRHKEDIDDTEEMNDG